MSIIGRLTHAPVFREPGKRRVLLIVLVFLLVFMLGLVVSMRGSIVTTQLVGNNLQRQKDAQISDIALAQVEALMVANSQTTGQPLELSVGTGAAQPAWWRDVSPGTAPPDASTYWGSCVGNTDATLRCAALTVTNNGSSIGPGYTVQAVVQPTGRTDTSNCNIGPFLTANYYDIYLRIYEASSATTSITETVYKICTR